MGGKNGDFPSKCMQMRLKRVFAWRQVSKCAFLEGYLKRKCGKKCLKFRLFNL